MVSLVTLGLVGRGGGRNRGLYLQIGELPALIVGYGLRWRYKAAVDGGAGFVLEAVVDSGSGKDEQEGGADGGSSCVGSGDDLDGALGFTLGLRETMAHE